LLLSCFGLGLQKHYKKAEYYYYFIIKYIQNVKETLLYLLKEAMQFALVEDFTYLDPVHNLLTNKQKILCNKNYQEIAINQILIIS
jgi:hypothetical protein